MYRTIIQIQVNLNNHNILYLQLRSDYDIYNEWNQEKKINTDQNSVDETRVNVISIATLLLPQSIQNLNATSISNLAQFFNYSAAIYNRIDSLTLQQSFERHYIRERSLTVELWASVTLQESAYHTSLDT